MFTHIVFHCFENYCELWPVKHSSVKPVVINIGIGQSLESSDGLPVRSVRRAQLGWSLSIRACQRVNVKVTKPKKIDNVEGAIPFQG